MPQQHVFGRDGGVGLELEDPMAVRPLLAAGEASRWRSDRPARSSAGRRSLPSSRRCGCVADSKFASYGSRCDFAIACTLDSRALYSPRRIVALTATSDHRTRSAARLPERIAPSMVAGKPVSVQSPARTQIAPRGGGAGPHRHSAPASPRRWRGARARSATAAARSGRPAMVATSLPQRPRQSSRAARRAAGRRR